MGRKSDARDATQDLISGIRSVFKQYPKGTRRKAWDTVSSSGGKQVINKLITDPRAPIYGIPRLLGFKEWLESNHLDH